MMSAAIAAVFATTALGVLLSGCQKPIENHASAGPYNVVATVGMIADIVRNVAGERANVSGMIGEGVDPHLYKPNTSDVKALQAADVVFYNGLMLEGKMADVLVRVARTGKPVHAVTDAIVDQGNYVLTNKDEHYDPHVWMDVQGWIRATQVVADALAEYDAAQADHYQQNAESYIAKLEKLDAYAKETVNSIPESKRVLVTAHDAFNYTARAYGLSVKAIQGLSTESEAGVKDIENLVAFLVEHDIPAVFVESSVSDKNVRALVEGAKARGHEVTVGGELYSDAMGGSGTYEGTYIGMIDHNMTTIARALGGKAPEKGMNGKLSN
ncbi:MAG: zinc ABC transporter substrate-binding protein [Verrucomicrobiae bacterium]|nr:zinc ABC transporter substrate-binding protein [Verrucomicrobiae bacterium]